jgi:hypothetical protein
VDHAKIAAPRSPDLGAAKTRANGYAFPKSARNFLSIGRHPDA